MQKVVYLDNAATTVVDPAVLQAMMPHFTERYGNASSIHSLGQDARNAVETARGSIASSIGARADEIIFTSGGTEGNNFAIKGIAFANHSKGNHIITTKVEHKCILNSCAWLETQGFKVSYLDVDKEGFVKPEQLSSLLTDKTLLVSIIHGNNEIGTIQDLEAIGKICKEHDVPLHTDACQSYTKTELNVKKQNLSLVTLNAHKIHGPKGVGALYVKEGTQITPWQHGGGQEFKLRGGTENVPGLVGFAKAVEIGMDKKHNAYVAKLRDKLVESVLKIDDTQLNGPTGSKRLSNNANFSFMRIEGEALGAMLEQDKIATSTGSACASRSLERSHVLRAIGLNDEQINGSIRMSVSRFNTEEEMDYAIAKVDAAAKNLRKISPFKKVMNSVFGKGA